MIENECGCPDGTFEDYIQFNCPNCNNNCLTCVDNSQNCLTCRGDRIEAPFCICPNGYYDDFTSEFCQPCSFSCLTCDIFGCTSCSANRVGPVLTKCMCPIEKKGVSRLELDTNYCSTCDLGVPSAIFSTDLRNIIIDFGNSIKLKDDSYNICGILFENNMLQSIGGEKSYCSEQAGKLNIQLGRSSISLKVGEQIKFNNNTNIIYIDGCSQTDDLGLMNKVYISEFLSATLQIPPTSVLKLPEIITNNLQS